MPKRLAEIVIDAALVSRDSVLKAVRIADEQRIPLVAALVHHLGVDELALVAAIKRQVRVPIADPAQVQHDPEALRELSQEISRRLRVMPLSISVFDTGTKVLHLAMADPTDTIAIAEIEHTTGCQVESALMPLSAVEEMVDKSYRSFVTEVMRRDGTRFGDKRSLQPQTAEDAAPSELASELTSGLTSGLASGLAQPSTVPFHRIADEASLEVRHQALLNLLLERGLITAEDYEEHIRLLLKQRGDAG